MVEGPPYRLVKTGCLFTLAVIMSTGCGASLVARSVPNESINHPKGVRFFQARNYKVTITCNQQKVAEEILQLPDRNQLMEVNYEGGILSHDKFIVELFETGTLQKVSLNSDTKVPETLNALAELGKAGGFHGIPGGLSAVLKGPPKKDSRADSTDLSIESFKKCSAVAQAIK